MQIPGMRRVNVERAPVHCDHLLAALRSAASVTNKPPSIDGVRIALDPTEALHHRAHRLRLCHPIR